MENNNLHLIELTRQQIIDLYETMMAEAFPPSELRPLKVTVDIYDMGRYIGYGLVDDSKDGSIEGCAFFIKSEDEEYLFDYFVIAKECRDRGYGSLMLDLIREKLKNAELIFGEVEDPDYANDEKERLLRNRRIDFYLRNNCIVTDVKVYLFKVDYLVMELYLGKKHDSDMIAKTYTKIYESVLPPELFAENVRVK